MEKLQLKWDDVNQKEELIPTDHKIEKAQLLFQKIEDSEIDYQINKLLIIY